MKKRFINVSEVAQLFELSIPSVNYYTNMGLIIVRRKKGNKRLYDREETDRRIKKVRSMMNEGYTLKLIQREFLNTEQI